MTSAHLHDVDLNLLVALDQLLQTRSVTAAARRMQLTQPAMSRVLGRLRQTFDDPLFVRGPRGLLTTPRAEAITPLLAEALVRVDHVLRGPERFDPQQAARTFTVATADYGTSVMLPALLARLRVVAPRVSVRVVVKTGDWQGALERGEWDLAWSPRPRERDAQASTVVWSRLLDETFGFVVRARHPVAKGRFTLERFLRLDQLAISPEGRPGNHLDQTLARLGHRRRVVASVPSFLVVPALVSSSDLGAVLPRRIIAHAATFAPLVELPLPFALAGFDLSQAWHERARHDPGHSWFRTLIRDVAAEL
jgi:DNA-binding transcriptional LysR family regulator